ncbi:RNA-binding protein with serine-rich domain 1-like [Portunus trituberculatus]|uniref:RNA-binding protein with serine-rich domain 1-like n=1 Tax=Portunus trituberculatus TaxID=210409 RepID=UPI001E1D1FAE|nr:RNA-binding protein with serine-rich domain 1-like [Portunus trituberculatus]
MLVFKMDTTGLFRNGQKHEIRISLPRDKHRAKPPPPAPAPAPPMRRGSLLSQSSLPLLHHGIHSHHRRGSVQPTLRRHPHSDGEQRAPRVPAKHAVKEVRFALDSGVWRPEEDEEEDSGVRSKDEGSSSEGGSSTSSSNSSRLSTSSRHSTSSRSSSRGSSSSSSDRRKKRSSSRSSNSSSSSNNNNRHNSREQVSRW